MNCMLAHQLDYNTLASLPSILSFRHALRHKKNRYCGEN